MKLLEQIQASCTPEQIALRNDVLIAELVNAWRKSHGITRKQSTAIGKGIILAVLGEDAGNAFLDVIYSVPAYRYVKDIITAGNFDLSLDVSIEGVQKMVPDVLTQVQADALLALGVVDDTITYADIPDAFREALQ